MKFFVTCLLTSLLTSFAQAQEPYFYLYQQTRPLNYYNLLSLSSPNSLNSLNRAKDYVFIVHGFNSNVNKTYWLEFKDNLLKKVNLSLIMNRYHIVYLNEKLDSWMLTL